MLYLYLDICICLFCSINVPCGNQTWLESGGPIANLAVSQLGQTIQITTRNTYM